MKQYICRKCGSPWMYELEVDCFKFGREDGETFRLLNRDEKPPNDFLQKRKNECSKFKMRCLKCNSVVPKRIRTSRED